MDDSGAVVWWALALGGLTGGLARLMLDGQLVMPQFLTVAATGQRIWYPGFVGPLLLGPVAAFAVTAASATATDWQTAFDLRGFLGPFTGSIAAGVGASYVLEQQGKAQLAMAEDNLEGIIDERFAILSNRQTPTDDTGTDSGAG